MMKTAIALGVLVALAGCSKPEPSVHHGKAYWMEPCPHGDKVKPPANAKPCWDGTNAPDPNGYPLFDKATLPQLNRMQRHCYNLKSNGSLYSAEPHFHCIVDQQRFGKAP